MQDDEQLQDDESRGGTGAEARSVRGGNGRQDSSDSHEEDDRAVELRNREAITFDEPANRQDTDEVSDTFSRVVSAEFSGPLPPPNILRGYDEVVPGSAAKIVDEHIYKSRTTSNSLRNLSNAEALSVSSGALGVVAIALTGIIGGIVLISSGADTAGYVFLIPSILTASAQLFASLRRGRKGESDE